MPPCGGDNDVTRDRDLLDVRTVSNTAELLTLRLTDASQAPLAVEEWIFRLIVLSQHIHVIRQKPPGSDQVYMTMTFSRNKGTRMFLYS